MKDATGILQRHPANPIITTDDLEGAMVVFNPSPVMYGKKTVLVLSVYTFEEGPPCRGSYVATSDDGVHFHVNDRPLIDMDQVTGPLRWVRGVPIDNRVARIDDVYYLVTPMFTADEEGPFALLGKTIDFETYEPIEVISLPPNRGASLFPARIDGKYYKLDRPGSGSDRASIWISSSPDLIHWGCYHPLQQANYAIWNRIKIGPTPPIETPEGWLVIVHGVFSWTVADRRYYIGAMLLDLEDPTRVIGKTQSWLLSPDAEYEARGQVDNVVFPCGAIADAARDELRLYYGAADTCVGLASGSLSDVIEACKRQI